MESESPSLDDLADAVLEGDPVDWESVESSADAPRRDAVRQLKVLAGITELHKNLIHDTPASERARVTEAAQERWGRLKILESIGKGSFGQVYRAWDTKLDREVAVKLLHADRAVPVGAAVLREARLLARVRHPNVVTVYDADEIDGRVGLWMEFIRGRNLEQILKERQRFDDREVTRIGIDVCRALSAVHDAGLVHRDIKTQNLMQTVDGRLVLMDFGTGRELDQTSSASVDAAGTPLYLAPEVFRGADATVRSDIYSTGVLLFHLLTGGYPVRGTTVEELDEAHAQRRRLDLPLVFPRRSRALAGAIGRALQPDPSKRFETVKGMLAALESVQRRKESRRTRLYSLAAAAAFLAVVGIAVVASRDRGAADPGGKSQAAGAPGVSSTPQKRAVQVPAVMFSGTPSPDGNYFPYSELATGNLALYEFATGTSRILTTSGDGGHENFAMTSIVSPDSGRIAYEWADASCGCTQIRVIDTAGADGRVLYSSRGTAEIFPLEWSHDGREILGTRLRSPGETDVVLLSTLDGSVRSIRTLSPGSGRVSLSPDGRYVAYDRPEGLAAVDSGIYLSSIAGGEEILAVTGPTNDSDPMWTPDGSGLVFASTRTGGPGLWLQRVGDGRPIGYPELLDKEMGPFGPITLTQRGALFYSHRTGLMDVYTAPIDPATGEVIGEPTNAASRVLGSNVNAGWSPDGETLAFASWRTSGRNILVLRSLKTGAEREMQLDTVANGVHWSPDGRAIAVGGGLVDPESGRVVPNVLGPRNSFAWAPDGRHGYLSRVREDPAGIFKADVQTGEEEPLYHPPPDSVMGGLSLSPDGRWLAFSVSLRPQKIFRLMAIPTGGGATRQILDIPWAQGSAGIGGWTRDGRRIFFTVTTSRNSEHYGELWVVPFDGGPARSLGLNMRALRDVRVSPDGTRISFTSGYPASAIWVYENFLPQIERR